METKTDNQIIAEFMGIRVRYQGPVLYHCEEDGFIDFVDGADTYSPHLDWSDLMPVVEKISESDCVVTIRFNRKTYTTTTAIDGFMKGWASDLKFHGKGIESTYKAVVEFIKWYNQQSPNS